MHTFSEKVVVEEVPGTFLLYFEYLVVGVDAEDEVHGDPEVAHDGEGLGHRHGVRAGHGHEERDEQARRVDHRHHDPGDHQARLSLFYICWKN